MCNPHKITVAETFRLTFESLISKNKILDSEGHCFYIAKVNIIFFNNS